MRALFIAVVLIATLLTFYSALWFKSITIEEDITARVTDALGKSGADGVAVDVDGRHVTLSGVVYDEAVEAAHLDTADKTYGALGPIDGLTYLSGGGFLKAVKSADGITLTGSVPSQDARTAIVDAAAKSTGGSVDDQLTIGGAAGDWQGEADFGLGQMAGLSAGALAVAPGSYTLSGNADGDLAAVRQPFADRAGWQTFVSSPAVENDLTAQLDAATGQVADRDQTITDLTGERDAVIAERNAAFVVRDTANSALATTQQELDDLRASLDENQTSVATVTSERDVAVTGLAAATAALVTRDQTIEGLNTDVEGLNGQVSTLTGQNSDLQAELDAQKAAMSGDQQQVSDLQAKLTDGQTQIDGLTADLGARDATIAGLQSDLGDKDSMIADLKAATDTSANTDDQVAQLNETLATRDGTIADLNDKLADTDGTIADLNGRLDEADSTIAELNGKIADTDGKVAQLMGQLETKDQAQADAETQLAALTAQVGERDAQVDRLDTKVTDLMGVVAERDATIAGLRATSGSSPDPDVSQMAAECSARANTVLESARINFATATAQIDGGSVETLERLTGIALACAGSGLNIEVGGHTDSQGTDENNQALSERRAQAVTAFMAERGVPTAGLKAVGYGEAQPVADNATPEGRAQNRRISFDWQAR